VLASDLVGFFCPFVVFVVDARFFGDGLGRYVYQLEVKSGWSSVSTCFGGSVPLQGDLSSGELGFWSFFEASDSSLRGDAILRSGCSAFTVHVRYDMLLKTTTKKKLCFLARKEVGFKLYAPAGGG
jgi:hypothetical protein